MPESLSAGRISIYVVRPGDTLSEIATLFNVSVNTIAWANNLSTRTIREGQTLVILPISGVRHTIVKGDTIAKVAKKYKADAEEIAQYNDLSLDSSLAVGEIILIPDGEITPIVSPTAPRPRVLGGGGPTIAGYYIRPMVNGVRTQGLHGYNGVDIAGPYGEPILAAAAGTVIVARSGGWNGGYGSYIVIAHNNGTQTLYAHLGQVDVYPGQLVAQGQVIGKEGATGRSTGAHLHFEIRGAANPF